MSMSGKGAAAFALLLGVCIVVSGAPARADVCTVWPSGKPHLSRDDPAFPKCHFNPARSEWKCSARDAVLCGSTVKTWSCPAGKMCNGDGSPGVPACR